ncbi:glycosyltransferase [Pseudomonas neustonica]|uniref:glycosyltransferase n=1 Tax=Pseudomonas neustonica TaxID=2487346 RepID=UPI003F45850F
MKVLLVVTGLGVGGAEHVVCNLADALASRDHVVKVVCLTGKPVVVPSNSDISVVSVGMVNSIDFFRAYFQLRAIIKDFQPDAVHSHMFHANMICRLLRLSIKIPRLVCSAHNTYEGGRARMLAYRLSDYLADNTTNVSAQAVSAFVLKKASKSGRIQVVYNGIDVDRFSFSPASRAAKRKELSIGSDKLLLAVGRLDAQKDYPNLFEAVSILYSQRTDFKLFVVGDGPLNKVLHNFVLNLGLDNCIKFLSVRSDISELMSAADVFVLSSAWEGFGLVVAEAMACERVVVATDCGGVSEVVGQYGLLVDAMDSEALSRALYEALEIDVDKRLEMGSDARSHIVDNFSLDKNVATYLDLYFKCSS